MRERNGFKIGDKVIVKFLGDDYEYDFLKEGDIGTITQHKITKCWVQWERDTENQWDVDYIDIRKLTKLEQALK